MVDDTLQLVRRNSFTCANWLAAKARHIQQHAATKDWLDGFDA